MIFPEVEVLDFAGPFEVFSVASQLHNHELFEVKLLAKQRAPVMAVNGLSVNPHYSFEDAPLLDIFIIAGGSGSRALLEDKETLDWVDRTCDQTALVMSICSGARLLGRLGFLDDRPYCTHAGVYNDLSELVPGGKPQYEKRFVKSNQGLYTSGGISAGIDLSFHMVETLHGKEVARQTAIYMEYKGYKPAGHGG